MMGLVFKLATNQRYTLPIDCIREVVVSQPLSSIPGSHPDVMGMFHLRGNVIPVLDAPSMIERGRCQDFNIDAAKIVICELGENLVGIAISEAFAVQTFDEQSRRESGKGSGYVTNIWVDEGQHSQSMVIELDPFKLFSQVEGELESC